MDLFKKLFAYILRLFGAGPSLLAAGLSEADKARIASSTLQGRDELTGASNIRIHGTGASAKIIKRADGADLIDEDGEQAWVSRIDGATPRAAWVDVWGPLATIPADKRVEEFCYHSRLFDDQHGTGHPLEAEAALLAVGYASVGEYYRVRTTLFKYEAQPTGPGVGDVVMNSQAYMTGIMKAGARAIAAAQAATVAGNPELLAPVDGVTVDMYAQIAAKMAQGLSQPDAIQFLAGMNLDIARWEHANTVWCDRMSKDLTGTIASIFGKAFMSQGQSQFGAAGQAANAWDGTAAGGPEPIPFEKYCEIQGAMSAWSKTGKDVNALLSSKFQMRALDWSAASTWWMSQMTANMSRFDDYKRRSEQFEQQYTGAKGGGDQDIQF